MVVPLTSPATAEWDRAIGQEDYNKILQGYNGKTMEDKFKLKADTPKEANGDTILHISFGWDPNERIALDIVVNDASKSDAQGWATIVKISWAEEELGSREQISEYDAKSNAISWCNHFLGLTLEDEDPDEYEDLDEDGKPVEELKEGEKEKEN